jgi:hypothetical protein
MCSSPGPLRPLYAFTPHLTNLIPIHSQRGEVCTRNRELAMTSSDCQPLSSSRKHRIYCVDQRDANQITQRPRGTESVTLKCRGTWRSVSIYHGVIAWYCAMSDLVVEGLRVVVSWRNSWGWVTQYGYHLGLSIRRIDVSVIGYNSLEFQNM